MKGLISIVIAVMTGVLLADPIMSANTFGVQKVRITAKNTVIGVPWTDCVTGGDISVQDIVKTANLSVGDQLMVYGSEAGKYTATFMLQEDGGVRSWVRTDLGGSETVTLARGKALLLSRVSDVAVDIYLHGQAETAAVGEIPVIAVGTDSEPKFTLIAPPMVGNVALELDDNVFVEGVGKNDTVWVPNSVERYWQTGSNKNAFGKKSWSGTVTPITIAPGTGFWYVSRGGSPTVKW